MATKRTTSFKLRVLELHLKEKLPAKEAFAKACQEHGTIPSGCMTDYSTSYMWDYKVWLKQQVEKQTKINQSIEQNKNIDPDLTKTFILFPLLNK